MTLQVQTSSTVSHSDMNISQSEVQLMAKVIEDRHGEHAFIVAHKFMVEHKKIGDVTRANAWGQVAKYIFENTELS